MSISTLAGGLGRLGHRVDSLRPRGFPVALPRLLERIAYNLRLPERTAARAPDLAVGFDVDGVFLGADRSFPLVVQLKGVAADEARFEQGAARWHLRLLATLEGRNARRADRVVVPSRYSARAARDAYGLAPDHLRVVPEALAPDARRVLQGRPIDPARPGGFTVLSVARQYPRKNTGALLRAFSAVSRALPAARLRIVGGGPLLPDLRTLVPELGLEGTVRILGSLPEPADVWKEYLEADCFCLPSLQEGFGIVFLEAMAAGLPVVAGRAGAVPEVVPDGEAGLLVDPSDPDDLADALVRVLSDGSLAGRLGRAGRKRSQRYTPEASARSFLEAVDDLPAGERTGTT